MTRHGLSVDEKITALSVVDPTAPSHWKCQGRLLATIDNPSTSFEALTDSALYSKQMLLPNQPTSEQ